MKFKPKYRVGPQHRELRRRLMVRYAKLCGYNYPPFSWRESDYTAAGWRALIAELKR